MTSRPRRPEREGKRKRSSSARKWPGSEFKGYPAGMREAGTSLTERKGGFPGNRRLRRRSAPLPVTDEEMFLDALGRMDVSFKDEMPAEEDPTPAPGG